MSLAITYTRASLGINAPQVTVEVDISPGLPSFNIVGLAETSVKESRDRVRSALINSHFQFPDQRITVNLAPADLPKEGGRYDLPIAMGILAASQQLSSSALADYEFYGELALSGDIRAILGEIPVIYACAQAQRICVLPTNNAKNGQLIKQAKIISTEHIKALFLHFSGQQLLSLLEVQTLSDQPQQLPNYSVDFKDVIGQPYAKRALEIAAAGQHNLLMIGPAGTGKSMLAQRLISILPPLTDQEALSVAAIRSICGEATVAEQWYQRPYRAPHHTASGIALVGGGSQPKPGEISLAHHGVLFLDEITEFERKVLDVLREPLETGEIIISRAAQRAKFPAQFQLIAAMNPSPTGDIHDKRASLQQVKRYLNRLSGPLLERIDLQIDVPRLPNTHLLQTTTLAEPSIDIRKRVLQARAIQLKRAQKPNALLTVPEIKEYCLLTQEDQLFLQDVCEQLQFSIRVYHKILKISRTIADLEQSAVILRRHLHEALGYRALEKLIKTIS